ncbi:shematrin-like protein 1 [Dermacentor albipictus]|uniref:shematrin-like protein 1 n=1 Tax=Dermacentor albipictus TaxID=60249 RepID=UPI0031FC1FD3
MAYGGIVKGGVTKTTQTLPVAQAIASQSVAIGRHTLAKSIAIRACIFLALATCAFGVYSGYPYGYSAAAPAAYGSYHASLGALTSYGHGAQPYGYGLGSYGLSYGQGLVDYSVAAPAYAAHHAPLASVSAVHHASGLGYGVPAYGFGIGSFGLTYGHGLGGLGYSTFLQTQHRETSDCGKKIRACVLLALATCAFGVYSGYPYDYSVRPPAAYRAYHAPLASVSSYGYGIRACVLLAIATCAIAGYAGYPVGHSFAAPAYGAYHAPLSSVSTVHHAPGFGYGLGYGVPTYGFGLGSYGHSYGYGLGGLGYSTFLRKKCETSA